jgi:hypothetical protein
MRTVSGLKCPESRYPHGLLILSFTAQPEVPASAKAGAFGWASTESHIKKATRDKPGGNQEMLFWLIN